MKHFIRYAYQSKTKFKVHSPFVFSFINEVLESSKVNENSLPSKVINFYTKSEGEISIAGNAGQGSISIKKDNTNVKSFLKQVSLPAKYGNVLAKMCEVYEVEEVIELGTSLGISTAYLAMNPLVNVHTVEANSEIYDKAKRAFKHLGASNVNFINAKFDDVLKDFSELADSKKIIFIDGDHNKESCLRYFKACLNFIQEDAIIVFDDIYWSEEMTEAWYDIRSDERVSLSIDLFRMGIVFFRKEQLHQEHFQLWY